jgi:hypothetical protein
LKSGISQIGQKPTIIITEGNLVFCEIDIVSYDLNSSREELTVLLSN